MLSPPSPKHFKVEPKWSYVDGGDGVHSRALAHGEKSSAGLDNLGVAPLTQVELDCCEDGESRAVPTSLPLHADTWEERSL